MIGHKITNSPSRHPTPEARELTAFKCSSFLEVWNDHKRLLGMERKELRPPVRLLTHVLPLLVITSDRNNERFPVEAVENHMPTHLLAPPD